MKNFVFVILIFTALPGFSKAQTKKNYFSTLQTITETDSLQLVIIKTEDKSEFVCRIVALDSEKVKVKTKIGLVANIPLSKIVSVKLFDETGKDDFLKDRLFFAFTGNMLKAKTVYLNDVEIFLPEIFVGVADYLTIGGGFPLIFYNGIHTFYFTAKVKFFDYKNFNSAFGSGLIIADEIIVLPFVAGTMNFSKTSVTIGTLGQNGFANDFYFYCGGTSALSKRFSLITENWLMTNDIVYSLGIRYTGENIGVDIGFFNSVNTNTFRSLVPWLGAFIKF